LNIARPETTRAEVRQQGHELRALAAAALADDAERLAGRHGVADVVDGEEFPPRDLVGDREVLDAEQRGHGRRVGSGHRPLRGENRSVR
jgi:hypothetical protein